MEGPPPSPFSPSTMRFVWPHATIHQRSPPPALLARLSHHLVIQTNLPSPPDDCNTHSPTIHPSPLKSCFPRSAWPNSHIGTIPRLPGHVVPHPKLHDEQKPTFAHSRSIVNDKSGDIFFVSHGFNIFI